MASSARSSSIKSPVTKYKNSLSNVEKNGKRVAGVSPTSWKNKKRGKLRFQPLGRTKNAAGCVSNPLENQKTLKIVFPTPWKNEKCRWLHFQPLGKIFLTTNFIINL